MTPIKFNYSVTKKYGLGALLCLLLIFKYSNLPAYSLNTDQPIAVTHVFDTLKQIPKADRFLSATEIYKKKFRHASEQLAMQSLAQLISMARKLDDKPLEAIVFDLKADYYAVNRKYNNLSIALYQQALDFEKENDLPLQMAITYHDEGMFYSNFKRNTNACLCFLKSDEKFKEFGLDKVPNISFYYAQAAEFYYHLGDFDNARAQLQEALKYKSKKTRENVNMTNTIGLIYRNYNQYPQAMAYFNKALYLAQQSKDSVWIGIAKGNIGSVYFMQGQYDKALPYIQTDYKQSLKYKENGNATIALLRLVKIDLIRNKINEGLKQLDTAEVLTRNNPASGLNLWITIYDLKAGFYEKMGMTGQALNFRKKYEMARDSLIKQNNIAEVELVKMQWVTGKHLAEESKLKADAEVDANERNTIFIVLFLLLIISVLIYSRQALKTKKDKEILLSEKRLVDEELKFTESKLHSYTENLKKNNALIESFKQQIDQLKKKNVDNNVVEQLEKLMQAHIMTDDTWMEFRKIFLKVYPNFFFDLKNKFAYLSETDIRLLTLIKLQSSNKEMANMLGITIEGVIKSKQRLRKKMGLDDNAAIEEIILKL